MINRDSMRRVLALIVKEFYQIIRDPSSILVSVVLPLILLFIYGYGVSLDMNHLNIGLVLEDTSPAAQSLASAFTNSRYFNVKVGREAIEFTDDIMEGKIRGVVVIPAYFSEFRKKPDVIAPIQVIADGSEPNTANFVQNYARGAYQNWLKQESISSKLTKINYIAPETRFWYNEELESRNFLIPGSIAIIMTLIGTLLTALVVAKEWERGTMEALMSTPVTIVELLTGKLIPYFLLGMGSMMICFLVAVLYYNVPFRGSFWILMVVSGSFLLSALGLGLLISTLAKNQFVAAQAAIIAAFLPGFILSGFVFEITSMPTWIQTVTYLIPARYFVSSLQTLFLAGDVTTLIIHNLIPIWSITAVLFFLISRKTVKRLD
jgi:ABC-2 type transport system permease protein